MPQRGPDPILLISVFKANRFNLAFELDSQRAQVGGRQFFSLALRKRGNLLWISPDLRRRNLSSLSNYLISDSTSIKLLQCSGLNEKCLRPLSRRSALSTNSNWVGQIAGVYGEAMSSGSSADDQPLPHLSTLCAEVR